MSAPATPAPAIASPIGYVLVRPEGDRLEVDWDLTVHPTRKDAEAVLPVANARADEDDEGEYRIVALVDLDRGPTT